MGRSGFIKITVFVSVLVLTAGLLGCSHTKAVTNAVYAVPASITLSPTPYASLELGTTQAFSAAALSATRTAINEPIYFQSSNTAVLTIASNGTACAGSWDNLSNPQICTPGPVGVALVTATAEGVTSPAATVYVHQHIDNVVVGLTSNEIPPTTPCLSVGQVLDYQATAYSRGVNITSSVGIFNWSALNPSVVKLNPAIINANGLLPGQVAVTATLPGRTPIFASIGNANSVPVNFTTCAVQSILLQVTASSSNSDTITPTVFDTLGNNISSVPLTWTSSQPASVTVTSKGIASGSSSGGSAAIIASCTPPSCNVGFLPTLPIYPENVVDLIVNGSSGGSGGSGNNSQSATIYVTSTGCGTNQNCFATLVPITAPANTISSATNLPAIPNSLIFNGSGSTVFMGTNSGELGTKGLMVLSPGSNSANQSLSTPGKVLAVSPDGLKVILSDTADTPNEVFVYDVPTGTNVAYPITGATAADFSPDSLKAYIVAGSTLYVYSKLDALQTIPLSAPVNDVSFLAEGAFAYLAGGAPNSVTVRRTCDGAVADTINTPPPIFIKTLPDAAHVIGLNPPLIDIIHVDTAPSGCTPSVSDSVTSYNFGVGNFTPTQLILSQDGTTAYVVASDLHSILVFNIGGLNSSAIALSGNATPVQAALIPQGTLLYVAASDGTVHVLDTAGGGDFQQIPFPENLCVDSSGNPSSIICKPDLITVKP